MERTRNTEIDQRSLMFTVWDQKVPTNEFCPSVVASVSYLGMGRMLSHVIYHMLRHDQRNRGKNSSVKSRG